MTVDLDRSIVVNFKTYEQATGAKAVKLAGICDEVAEEAGANIVVAVQAVDIRAVAEAVSIPVFAQHIDPVKYGSSTGWILPEAVLEAGAVGTLISHSEHKLAVFDIEPRVNKARELGLTSIVCSGMESNEETIKETKEIAALKPDFIAAEPPDLIGGDVSVTTRPDLVRGVVEAVKEVDPDVSVLTGAGVKTGDDVHDALELGTRGVLLASGVTKAEDPKKALMDLCKGLE
ncbi:MAG: triose-phosphate isomerase [Candidatus Altiarchaeales archaeon]|nr:triose-phosphate isomerase [Candidatus Altiarchaeales archaeon]MBD3416540.1 triose-phosphate isomerase [Candidatus Altiarchaeales archaeon]